MPRARQIVRVAKPAKENLHGVKHAMASAVVEAHVKRIDVNLIVGMAMPASVAIDSVVKDRVLKGNATTGSARLENADLASLGLAIVDHVATAKRGEDPRGGPPLAPTGPQPYSTASTATTTVN